LKGRVKQALQFIIFFGLGLGLMYWQFNKFNPDEKAHFFTALKTANYAWFALAIGVGMLAHLSRAVRWQQLLYPLGHKVGLGDRFYAVMFGYMANYGIPRSGEVIRCGILKTSDEVPFSEAFGTVVVERIIDMLCLLLVFVIVLAVEFSRLKELWLTKVWDPAMEKLDHLMQNQTAIIIIVIGLVVFIAAIFIFRKKIGALMKGKLGGFLKGFKDGILAVKKVPQPGWFIFHSLFIWTAYLLPLYICFNCFPETKGLTLNDALVILLFGTFGVVFTPGGIGLYQVIVTSVIAFLLHLSMDSQLGAPFAWLSWGTQVVTVVLFTGIAFAVKKPLNRWSK